MENFTEQLMASLSDYYLAFIDTLPRLGLAVLVFLFMWMVSKWLTRLTQRQLEEKVDDQLLARFLTRLSRSILFIITFAIVLHILGLGGVAAGLMTGAGISAFVIGFAFKDIGENLLAGIMLAFNRPFNIGHTIEVSGVTGSVISLNLRNTQIKTFDGKDVYIPNAQIIKNKVTNFVIDGFLRQDFTINLDLENSVEGARAIIKDVLANIPGVLEERAPSVHLTALGSHSKQLIVYYWLHTFDSEISGLEVKTQAIAQTYAALSKAGYYIPGEVVEVKNYPAAPASNAKEASESV